MLSISLTTETDYLTAGAKRFFFKKYIENDKNLDKIFIFFIRIYNVQYFI